MSQRITSTYSYVGWDTHQTIDPAPEASCSFSSLVLGSQKSARSVLAEVPRLVCIAAGSARYLHMAQPENYCQEELGDNNDYLDDFVFYFRHFLAAFFDHFSRNTSC